MLNEVRTRLTDRHVDFEVTEDAKAALVKEGFDPVYGARPLRRTVQRQIENPLAKRILAGEFTDGDIVRVGYDGETYTFEKAGHREVEPEREPVAAAS
jgi:ATP-dependent Clp protease ATP-binding subunit ClpA